MPQKPDIVRRPTSARDTSATLRAEAGGSSRARLAKLVQLGKEARFVDVLDAAEPRPSDDATGPEAQAQKKNYAQRVSEASALLFGNALREYLDGILPRPDGSGQESRARTGKGVKKLDVNYSTPELGLGLGVSVKTLNFRDSKTRRYTKNPTRNDNELRAEAMDYHDRQPYAVLVGVLFTPVDSCFDGNPEKPKHSRSSFAQIVNVLRHRSGRRGPHDADQLFERLYIGLYHFAGDKRGEVTFFNVRNSPPQFGFPKDGLVSWGELISEIVAAYDERNNVKPAWDNADLTIPTLDELEEFELLPNLDGADDTEEIE